MLLEKVFNYVFIKRINFVVFKKVIRIVFIIKEKYIIKIIGICFFWDFRF